MLLMGAICALVQQVVLATRGSVHAWLAETQLSALRFKYRCIRASIYPVSAKDCSSSYEALFARLAGTLGMLFNTDTERIDKERGLESTAESLCKVDCRANVEALVRCCYNHLFYQII